MTIKGQCEVIGPPPTPTTQRDIGAPCQPAHVPLSLALRLFAGVPFCWGEQILMVGLQFQQKLKSLNWRIFYLHYQYYFKLNKMKISSPFVEYIPDCKRNMRRLRKKIYKFITSKNYLRKQQSAPDLMAILTRTPLPALLQEQLAKRKTPDLSAIKNLSVPLRMPLREVAAITQRQEREVAELQQEWLESRERSKLRAASLEGLRETDSKRTLSSTEFDYDEEELAENSSAVFPREDSVQNLNQDIDFHHFERGNSFLQIESSILSQENLFKFQQ